MPSFRLETRQHIHVVEMRLQPHVMTDNLRRSAPRRILKRWFHYSDNHRDNVALCIRASRGLLLMREGRYGEGLQCYREAKAGANGILRRRLEQKILIEMARNDSACGHQNRAAKRLREAISSNADAEFTKEARDLLAGGCALN